MTTAEAIKGLETEAAKLANNPFVAPALRAAAAGAVAALKDHEARISNLEKGATWPPM